MTDDQSFVQQILSLEPNAADGYSEYGSRVMPVLQLYAALSTDAQRHAFREALGQMLADRANAARDFAIAICLGFIILYDAI